jgi:hypothetical protein
MVAERSGNTSTSEDSQGTGCSTRVLTLAIGREIMEAHQVPQHLHGVIVAALHDAAELIAAQGERDIIGFRGV